jgi:predicted nuclease of predicted toxin-antitoxin system
MGSLSSELRAVAIELSGVPRMYVDANVPQGAVAFMRHTLRWDVLFVLEEPELRRARDTDHFRRALDFGRTLITLDHDFLDERKFPVDLSPGVVICTAPDESGLKRLLRHLDQVVMRSEGSRELPLRGQVIELTVNSLTPEELRNALDREFPQP